MEILFEEIRSDKSLIDVTKQAYSKIKSSKFNSIGLVSTVQHVGQLKKAKEWLEAQDFKVYIGKPGPKAKYSGQILGCDVGSANSIKDKVNCIFYYGTGKFHALAVRYATDLPVFALDPFANVVLEISDQEKQQYVKKRVIRIAKAKEANMFGLMVSTKPGQNQLRLAEELKAKVDAKGKKAFIFLADTFNPNEILNFPDIDVWVNTACPRIVEDQDQYFKLLINSDELIEALN